MLTVERCLCFKLETGGIVIGWLTVISSILCALSSIILLILASVFSCAELAQMRKTWTSHDLDLCNSYRGVFIGAFVFMIALCIGFAYIGWRCIQGTKSRDHFRIKPLMILMAVAAILSLFQIFTFTLHGIFNGIINATIDGYCFIVLYSLYSLYRQEYESGGNRHPLQQGGKV